VQNCYIPPPRNFINFDRQIYKISETSNYFSASFVDPNGMKKSAKLNLRVFTKRELAFFLDEEFSDFFDTLIDEEENIHLVCKKNNKDGMVQIFTSAEIIGIINIFDDILLINRNNREVGWVDKFREITEKLIIANMNHNHLIGGLIRDDIDDLRNKRDHLFHYNIEIFYNIKDREKVLLTMMDQKDI